HLTVLDQNRANHGMRPPIIFRNALPGFFNRESGKSVVQGFGGTCVHWESPFGFRIGRHSIPAWDSLAVTWVTHQCFPAAKDIFGLAQGVPIYPSACCLTLPDAPPNLFLAGACPERSRRVG